MKGDVSPIRNEARRLTVGLIACVSGKRPARAPAKDLYTSSLFIKSRGYAEEHYDLWFILSAEYGLVEPDKVIEPYDNTLKSSPVHERREWSAKVFKVLKKRLPVVDRYVIFVHAGRDYREFLVPMLRMAGYSVQIPLEGLRIGEQLGWYKRQGY